jgi:SAM-dependent methyltransferase
MHLLLARQTCLIFVLTLQLWPLCGTCAAWQLWLKPLPTRDNKTFADMDSQHEKHGDSYAYSTPEWPEFYDLWVENLFGPGPAEDAAVFQNVLENLVAATPSEDIITVLDLGTGTGRVIRDLTHAVTLRHDTARFRFIGVDHSRFMLDRARSRFGEQGGMYATWLVGSAADFFNEALKGAEKIDILIFAAGGISHLTDGEETKSFLRQIKMGLRKNNRSVAIISILHEFIEKLEPKGEAQTALEAGDELQDVKIPSKDHQGIMYIKSPTTTVRNGSFRTNRFSLKAIRETEECGRGQKIDIPKTIWERKMEWSLRDFNEGNWIEEVCSAGLRISSVKEGLIQRWYFIQHAAV